MWTTEITSNLSEKHGYSKCTTNQAFQTTRFYPYKKPRSTEAQRSAFSQELSINFLSTQLHMLNTPFYLFSAWGQCSTHMEDDNEHERLKCETCRCRRAPSSPVHSGGSGTQKSELNISLIFLQKGSKVAPNWVWKRFFVCVPKLYFHFFITWIVL